MDNFVIDGYVTQVFIPLDFERQVLRRSASPTSNNRWHWITDDDAVGYSNRVLTITQDLIPSRFPNGRRIYLCRPKISGWPCAGILLHLAYQGQLKQVLLKDNGIEMYTRTANRTNNAWSAWRQMSTTAI